MSVSDDSKPEQKFRYVPLANQPCTTPSCYGTMNEGGFCSGCGLVSLTTEVADERLG